MVSHKNWQSCISLKTKIHFNNRCFLFFLMLCVLEYNFLYKNCNEAFLMIFQYWFVLNTWIIKCLQVSQFVIWIGILKWRNLYPPIIVWPTPLKKIKFDHFFQERFKASGFKYQDYIKTFQISFCSWKLFFFFLFLKYFLRSDWILHKYANIKRFYFIES